jgi:hypothetical protein
MTALLFAHVSQQQHWSVTTRGNTSCFSSSVSVVVRQPVFFLPMMLLLLLRQIQKHACAHLICSAGFDRVMVPTATSDQAGHLPTH